MNTSARVRVSDPVSRGVRVGPVSDPISCGVMIGLHGR